MALGISNVSKFVTKLNHALNHKLFIENRALSSPHLTVVTPHIQSRHTTPLHKYCFREWVAYQDANTSMLYAVYAHA